MTRKQLSADFPLSFFRRQSGHWCIGSLAWCSANGSEQGDVAWSIEQPRGNRVDTSAAAVLVEFSMASYRSHNLFAVLLCYPECG